MNPITEAFQAVLAAFDQLEVRFLIGGSLASSTHGLPRQTNDVDILAAIVTDQAEALGEALGGGFYYDAEHARKSIELGRPFNLIHSKSALKFDIYPAGNDPFAHSELTRRNYASIGLPGFEGVEYPVTSPEDTILAKLSWFRKGGEISDRQWNDIRGVLSVQRARLDYDYLSTWAERIGVADLLARLLAE